MTPDELQIALDRLHHELSQTTDVDDATRQRLKTLVGDIQRLAGASDPPSTASSSPSSPAEQPLTSSLQGLVADFEARHPQLTNTVQQLVDRLSEIGI